MLAAVNTIMNRREWAMLVTLSVLWGGSFFFALLQMCFVILIVFSDTGGLTWAFISASFIAEFFGLWFLWVLLVWR